MAKISSLLYRLVPHLNVDAAVDQHAKNFVHESLPPVLNGVEKMESMHGGGEFWDVTSKAVLGGIEIEPDSQLKLLRQGAVRLLLEDDCVRLYHSMENSREYKQFEAQFVEIEAHLAPAVEHLIHAYPDYCHVEDLPLESDEDKLDIANLLYDKGLVMVIQPDEGSSSSSSDDDDAAIRNGAESDSNSVMSESSS